ncbi:MAG TPA: hypothetical protein VN282_15895 [Pyrinomonadaceae bacterium]|nr:hypothetical protein [Pyrinomonadaceae bacterium]
MAKVQIKRMGVFSCAKIYSITLAAMGLIVGVIYGLIFIVLGGAMMAGGGRDAGMAGGSTLVIGLVMMIAIPVMYGIIGFIGGIVGALVYNVAAGIVGGLELEIENMDGGTSYAPPAPNWGDQPPYTPGQQQQYPY